MAARKIIANLAKKLADRGSMLDLDLVAILDEYMAAVNHAPIHFPDVAMLLQYCVQAYAKKVDMLLSIVLQMNHAEAIPETGDAQEEEEHEEGWSDPRVVVARQAPAPGPSRLDFQFVQIVASPSCQMTSFTTAAPRLPISYVELHPAESEDLTIERFTITDYDGESIGLTGDLHGDGGFNAFHSMNRGLLVPGVNLPWRAHMATASRAVSPPLQLLESESPPSTPVQPMEPESPPPPLLNPLGAASPPLPPSPPPSTERPAALRALRRKERTFYGGRQLRSQGGRGGNRMALRDSASSSEEDFAGWSADEMSDFAGWSSDDLSNLADQMNTWTKLCSLTDLHDSGICDMSATLDVTLDTGLESLLRWPQQLSAEPYDIEMTCKCVLDAISSVHSHTAPIADDHPRAENDFMSSEELLRATASNQTDVSRLLLATLTLANDGRVVIRRSKPLSMEPFEVHLAMPPG